MALWIFAVVAAAAGLPGDSAVAKVEWSHRPQPAVIVDQQAWRCEGNECFGQVIDKPYLKLRACRAIARYAGKVTSFSTPSGALSDEDLARCNRRTG
ncbi:MAG TPA: hypothetical protein VNH53_11550 [Sphingomicrobium sp.]|jgi:hypothetical protein|nr:hypothetical protein [Sphingomicrobium sp.]